MNQYEYLKLWFADLSSNIYKGEKSKILVGMGIYKAMEK